MSDIFDLPWDNTPILCFDTETTGFSKSDRICEVAFHVVKGSTILETFHTLVNPQRPISPGASEVHGIYDEDVEDSPEFDEIKPRVLEFLRRDIPWVAHNLSFDVRMLSYVIDEDEWPRGVPTLCTMDFAKKHHPSLKLRSGHKLLEIAGHLQINYDPEAAHNALNDVDILAKVVPQMMGPRKIGQSYTKLSEAWLKK